MNNEFVQLLELLIPPVKELLLEKEKDENIEKTLDFRSFPSIHCRKKKGVENG